MKVLSEVDSASRPLVSPTLPLRSTLLKATLIESVALAPIWKLAEPVPAPVVTVLVARSVASPAAVLPAPSVSTVMLTPSELNAMASVPLAATAARVTVWATLSPERVRVSVPAEALLSV